MMPTYGLATVLLSVLLLSGCGDDGGGVDAGDGGGVDAGDDGGVDAGDDGGVDAGDIDASGMTDAGGLDAFLRDAGLTRMTNIQDPTTCEDGIIFPSPGEEGHFAAARLTPPSYPFTVTHVEYLLDTDADGVDCVADFDHRALVWSQTEVTPAETPAVHEDIEYVSPGPEADGVRLVRHELTTPLVLADDEHLFVAVQMNADLPETLCLRRCEDESEDNRNFWSNDTDPPYPWADLKSFGIPGNVLIEALGDP